MLCYRSTLSFTGQWISFLIMGGRRQRGWRDRYSLCRVDIAIMAFVQSGDDAFFALGAIRLIGDGFCEGDVGAWGWWSERETWGRKE